MLNRVMSTNILSSYGPQKLNFGKKWSVNVLHKSKVCTDIPQLMMVLHANETIIT